jgi:hypothetical protein
MCTVTIGSRGDGNYVEDGCCRVRLATLPARLGQSLLDVPDQILDMFHTD